MGKKKGKRRQQNMYNFIMFSQQTCQQRMNKRWFFFFSFCKLNDETFTICYLFYCWFCIGDAETRNGLLVITNLMGTAHSFHKHIPIYIYGLSGSAFTLYFFSDNITYKRRFAWSYLSTAYVPWNWKELKTIMNQDGPQNDSAMSGGRMFQHSLCRQWRKRWIGGIGICSSGCSQMQCHSIHRRRGKLQHQAP